MATQFNFGTTNGQATFKSPPNTKTQQNGQISYVDHAIERTGASVSWASSKAKQTLDKVVTPEQSDALVQKAQEFGQTNPKLAAFLLINLVFTGVPLLLFAVFSIAVFVFSVTTGLILGIIGALLFTSSVLGIALIFVLPVLFLTTITATTIFFWSIVGLYVYSQIERRNKRRIE